MKTYSHPGKPCHIQEHQGVAREKIKCTVIKYNVTVTEKEQIIKGTRGTEMRLIGRSRIILSI